MCYMKLFEKRNKQTKQNKQQKHSHTSLIKLYYWIAPKLHISFAGSKGPV